MNAIEEFNDKFSDLFTQMVEIAFEFVNRNEEEVETIYIFTSLETGYFYNVFYRINGKVVSINKVNEASKEQFDMSPSRMTSLLRYGNELVQNTQELFEQYDREVPKSMQMVYEPKTGRFDNQIGYQYLYKNDSVKTASTVFDDWFDEQRSASATA